MQSWRLSKINAIEPLEDHYRYIFFLRPRKFGKSLFLSIMIYHNQLTTIFSIEYINWLIMIIKIIIMRLLFILSVILFIYSCIKTDDVTKIALDEAFEIKMTDDSLKQIFMNFISYHEENTFSDSAVVRYQPLYSFTYDYIDTTIHYSLNATYRANKYLPHMQPIGYVKISNHKFYIRNKFHTVDSDLQYKYMSEFLKEEDLYAKDLSEAGLLHTSFPYWIIVKSVKDPEGSRDTIYQIFRSDVDTIPDDVY
jgi:hypothetical protein